MTRKTTHTFSPEARARFEWWSRTKRSILRDGRLVSSIAGKVGCSAHTLNEWVMKAKADSGKRAGLPSDIAEKMKALERENRDFRQTNEILRKASAYFA